LRNCIDFGAPLDRATLRERQTRWTVEVPAADRGARRNTGRLPNGKARPLGADNAAVVAEYGARTTIIAAGSG
jgi:hypothetical protein